MNRVPEPDRAAARTALVALVATFAIQAFTALAAAATPVLTPIVAAELAVPERWIGVFVGLVYVGAMAASLLSGLAISRVGPIRASQACVLLCAIGLATIALVPTDAPWLLVPAALVVGVGYGPITPASSHVLARTAPPSRMALTFSIKQTGVPAGAALAGATLPALALLSGWRLAFLEVAVIGAAVALAAQPMRAALDADRGIARHFSWAEVRAPLAKVWRTRRLRELALVGFAYATTQACVLSFLVVFLTATLAWPIVAAGLCLTVATIAGVAGRIAWGVVADRSGRPRTVLAAVGAVAGVASLALSAGEPQWPTFVVASLCAVLGATAIGWNGVQLAEVAREAPPGEAGAITGGAGVITFFGVVAGPLVFSSLAAVTESYRSGFVLAGVLSGGCAAALRMRSAKVG